MKPEAHETWKDGMGKLPQKTAKATGYDPIEVEQPLPYGLDKDAVLAATKCALTGEIPAHSSPHQTFWLKPGSMVWVDEVNPFADITWPKEHIKSVQTYEWAGGETTWAAIQKIYQAQNDAIIVMLKETKLEQLQSYIIDTFAKGGAIEPPQPDEGVSNVTLVARLAEHIPGMDETVKCPVRHVQDTVRGIVIHLNDVARWSREEIADWLDTLSVDLTVQEVPPYTSTFVIDTWHLDGGMTVKVTFALAGTTKNVTALIPMDLFKDDAWQEWTLSFEGVLEQVAQREGAWITVALTPQQLSWRQYAADPSIIVDVRHVDIPLRYEERGSGGPKSGMTLHELVTQEKRQQERRIVITPSYHQSVIDKMKNGELYLQVQQYTEDLTKKLYTGDTGL